MLTDTQKLIVAKLLLAELIQQVDEDCPQNCRSTHLKEVILSAGDFLHDEN